MNFIAFDVETTGVEQGSRIVEVAAVLFENGQPTDRFAERVDPEMPIPDDVTKLHGISNDTVKGCRPMHMVLPDLCEWVLDASLNANEPLPLVAHNAPFDCGMVTWEAQRAGWAHLPLTVCDVIDTLAIAKTLGQTRSNKLAALVEFHEIEKPGPLHGAECDAILAGRYFEKVRAIIEPDLTPWSMTGFNYEYSTAFPDELIMIPTLVGLGLPLTFTYEDQSGETTERTVTPYGWALVDGKLRFHGFCHLRQARRTFLCERVLQVRDVEQAA